MKTIIVLFFLSISLIAQERSMEFQGFTVELGMSMDQVWEKLKSGFNVVEDEDGSFFISDKNDNPVGVIFFENEIAVKIIKDWGTSKRTNVGQVFKILWNVLKQYEKDLDNTEIIPVETFNQKGSKYSIQINITENRFLDITIQHNVTILEVLLENQN